MIANQDSVGALLDREHKNETVRKCCMADMAFTCKSLQMEYVADDAREDRLYLKALAIRYAGRIGHWMPIMWHLALRRHTGAMIELADRFSYDDSAKTVGSPSDAFSAGGLYRAAYRKGDARAAYNAAISCFNRNDMMGYRAWLRRAAKKGDADAARRLSSFETRLPHAAARKIGRLRPDQKRDECA